MVESFCAMLDYGRSVNTYINNIIIFFSQNSASILKMQCIHLKIIFPMKHQLHCLEQGCVKKQKNSEALANLVF